MDGQENYVIGVDFGTDSVRAVLVDAANGLGLACSVFEYPRWKKGLYCDAALQQFRQHPLDYIEGLESVIIDCVARVGTTAAAQVRAISIDTTGSSPVTVDRSGTPLALLPGFEHNPNAMFLLWKDHTSVQEAARINNVAAAFDVNYLQYVGGIYSSEWFWAKLMHVLKKDVQVKNLAYSFVEHCDWIPFLLCGGNDVRDMKRSVCAAGHKALWAQEFGGLPPQEFLTALDPVLSGWKTRLFYQVYPADQPAGRLSIKWADLLGLPVGIPVGVGAFDAHMGAAGGQIEPYYLSKVMGTSTCDILVAPEKDIKNILVSGICGQVPGSVIPGMIGMEAGQSAFGDVFAWVSKLIGFSIAELATLAAALPLKMEDVLATDWLNGRRTPDANQLLTAGLLNLNLSTGPGELFKAMVEATCFGAKAIVERFRSEGIAIKGLIGMGGVARKSPYIMQAMADVTGMPIRIHSSEQTCAMGAAMFAATVAGIYPKVEDAMAAMGQGFDLEYVPDRDRTAHYLLRYEKYKRLGGYIQQETAAENNIRVFEDIAFE